MILCGVDTRIKPFRFPGSHSCDPHDSIVFVLACWLSQNNQNKVITILFFAQYFFAFVARVFLSLDFAICLFPQFLTSMLPFFRSFVKVVVTVSQRDAFFSTSSPQNRSSAHCALLFLQFWGDLKMGFRGFPQKGENSARVSSGHVSRKA